MAKLGDSRAALPLTLAVPFPTRWQPVESIWPGLYSALSGFSATPRRLLECIHIYIYNYKYNWLGAYLNALRRHLPSAAPPPPLVRQGAGQFSDCESLRSGSRFTWIPTLWSLPGTSGSPPSRQGLGGSSEVMSLACGGVVSSTGTFPRIMPSTYNIYSEGSFTVGSQASCGSYEVDE